MALSPLNAHDIGHHDLGPDEDEDETVISCTLLDKKREEQNNTRIIIEIENNAYSFMRLCSDQVRHQSEGRISCSQTAKLSCARQLPARTRRCGRDG